MSRGRFLFSFTVVALSAALVQNAKGAIVITTNMNGADAEIRESDAQTELDGVTPIGTNRGTSTELATRRASNRSSVMYLQFDISDLTLDKLAGKRARLQLHVRNNNLPDSRLRNYRADDPNSPGIWGQNQIRMQFSVRGLDPNMVDGLANPNNDSADQVYDWSETGLTWYNAPGITPDDGTDVGNQVLGSYNFNSDAPELGKWNWPNVRPQNHLPVGLPLNYNDENGNLLQLVEDAITAGKDSVTVMINHDLAWDDGITPNSFIGFNYLVIPKEMTTLNNDSNYDSNGSFAGGTIGSPYSCLHANCPGGVLGDNTGGAFSPKLIFLPEPTSMLLLGFGSLASLALIRRRK